MRATLQHQRVALHQPSASPRVHAVTMGWQNVIESVCCWPALPCRLINCMLKQDFDSSKPAAECSSSLCTYNLHHLLCVLGVQAKYRGLTVYWLEAWVERAIGWLKRRSRDRVVHDAAHLAVSVELDNRGTQRAAAVLGRFKQKEGMDGVPSLLLGYSKLSELLHAPAAAADCAMYGDGQDMAADLWSEFEVGSSTATTRDSSASRTMMCLLCYQCC